MDDAQSSSSKTYRSSFKFYILLKYDRADNFQEGVAIVVKDGKKFLINERNEKIFYISGNVNLSSFSEGLAVAYSEVKPRRFQYGYMNLSGELIIPLEYERAEPFREGRGVVQSSETKKWGAVDSSGKLAIPHKFLNGIYFRDGMAVTAEDSSGMGVIDRNGAYMVSPKFKSIGRFSEGLARAVDKKTRKYGFINSKGEYEIEPTISYANEFSNGFAAIHDKQSKWGYIDKSGSALYLSSLCAQRTANDPVQSREKRTRNSRRERIHSTENIERSSVFFSNLRQRRMG